MNAPLNIHAADVILSVRQLSISFGAVQVLRDVSFDLRPGEIHALVGENGSGKSTFIKCLSGYYEPSAKSEIRVAGQVVPQPYGPAAALKLGLSFVHQDLALVPGLSVSDNLGLSRGFETSLGWRVRRDEQRDRTLAALAVLDVDINPDDLVEDLGQAEKTLVAIARGMDAGTSRQRILVLDEPTAALPAKEVAFLLRAIRRLANQGVAIIYVSHRLSEVLSLADRVTVIRDGRVVTTTPAPELDERRLVNLIIGQSLEKFYPPSASTMSDETVLQVEDLCGARISGVSFKIRHGEVLGVAGLLGSGRSELGRLLFGRQRKTRGRMRVGGVEVEVNNPADALRQRIGYVPEDRLHSGGVRTMTVRENLTITDMTAIWSNGRFSRSKERAIVQSIINDFNIRPNDQEAIFGSLSGGNQQKAIIARALRLKPRLLILDEPVQGVDIGAKTEIFSLIARIAQEGTSVLVIDSDIEDLCRLCDRVVVLRDGSIASELSGDQLTREKIAEFVQIAGAHAL
jgi:ribose transport system ATP-binding protein